MPITYPEDQNNSRKLKLVEARTFIRKIVSKLFFDPLQTIIVIFGILTLVFDLFTSISFLWYIAYITIIIGYFVDRWMKPTIIYKTQEENKPVDNS